MTIAKPFIPWVGGKEKLASCISQIFPTGLKQYVEPFGGSGSILLYQRSSESRLDIYNDLNSDLVNLFLCVRDKPLALMKELGFLPLHSRAEFELLKDAVNHEKTFYQNICDEMEVASDTEYFTPEQTAELMEILEGKAKMYDVHRAVAAIKISRGSFNGTMTSFGVKTLDLNRFLHLFFPASERLQGVVIEHKDALLLIRERNCDGGLIYCDPPYKDAEKLYTVRFLRKRHVRLWQVLSSCKGFFVLSYNDSPFIRQLYRDFFIIAFMRDNPMAKKQGAKYKELLITNYDPRPYLQTQVTMFPTEQKLEFVVVNTPAWAKTTESFEQETPVNDRT